MNLRDQVLSRLSASVESPCCPDDAPLMLDLTIWHKWHHRRGTLPPGFEGLPQAATAAALGAVAWVVAQPWEVAYSGIEVVIEQNDTERRIRYLTPLGTLTARWTLGPDGDWWQVEFPVKSADDLPAAHAMIAARRLVWAPSAAQAAVEAAGTIGIVALELPMRPYSDLLHTILGWSEGLILFAGEHAGILAEMLAILEAHAQEAAQRLTKLPGHVLFAPDNLDGQFVSPRSFRAYLQDSYRHTAEIAHAAGLPLIVHAGGPVRRLLPLLSGSGVDCVEGIAGPPQSDASLAEARTAAGPHLTLWGGIPQDLLVTVHSEADFQAAVRHAAQEAAGDQRVILGIADRVSVDSDPGRLGAVASLIRS